MLPCRSAGVLSDGEVALLLLSGHKQNNGDVCTKCIKLNLKCLRTNQKPPLLPRLLPRRLTNVSKTKPKI